MMAGDESYDDVTLGILHRADSIRAELKDMIPCRHCGAREPVRLGRDRDGIYGCSECRDYGRCYLCRRWTFEEEGSATSRLVDIDGAIRAVCDPCWEKGDVDIPLDYTEDEPDREGDPAFNGAFDRW